MTNDALKLDRAVRCAPLHTGQSSTIEAQRRRRFLIPSMAMCGALLLGLAASAAPHGLKNEWLSVNGDLSNRRYAPFNQINHETIAKLGAVWVSEPFADGASSRMTPVIHDGLMFLGAGPRIYALDARSGKLVWEHRTETRKRTGSPLEMMLSGLAITRSWGLGLGGGMVFAGMMNGHVIALREKSGEVIWDQLISDEPLAISKGIICPPLYLDGVLYFGLGGEATRGYVAAVDAKSGRVLWHVTTIAEPGQPGHETWPRDSGIWRSGGAHPWVAGAADPSLGLVYFVTSNAGPAAGGQLRPGDNLYTVSLLALQMKTGILRWYRQLIHHDVWEADLSIPPVLFDTKIGTKARKAVAVMRGDGYLFEFDRGTGEPLVPIEERPVPQNPALFTAATQPFPRGAESILSPCESWRSQLPAGFVLGCMFDPPSPDVPNRLAQGATVRLTPMSYSPQTGYFYVQGTNSLEWRRTYSDPYGASVNFNGERVLDYPKQTVVVAAIDSRTDRVIWRKELPTSDDSGIRSNGGALSTAGGLVFHQGGDGTLQAYDAGSGATLWRFRTDFAASDAAPMSYYIDGKQYVAFVAGSKIWAFALQGTVPQAADMPLPVQEPIRGPIEETNEIETLTLGRMLATGHRYYKDEYAFNPYRARVRAGTTVTFINNGFLPHTIVAHDGSWTTGTLAPTQIASITFDKPGSYIYTSKEYPWSSGQIIVIPATAGSSASSDASGTSAASEQVALGKATYAASCSACHGESLGGMDAAPALVGKSFSARWAGRSALDLFDRLRTTMPTTAPGSLSGDRYAAITSYILYSNEHAVPFTLDRENMKGVKVTAR